MPTEIVLDRSHDEAVRVVKTALANTDGITDIAQDGDVVVGRTRGGLMSGGERVNVYLQADGPAGSETTLSVWTEGDDGFMTSDPWRYKNGFLEELGAVRDVPTSDLSSDPEALDTDARPGRELEDGERRNKNAVVWLAAAKFLTVVLGFLLVILGVVVAIALL